MWTTVYVVKGLGKAKEIQKKLKDEGFLVKVNLIKTENDEETYEVIGPEFESKDIEEAMIELGIL